MCEFGDQAEYDYIIEQGQLEAENFGENVLFRTSISWVPARWLNPPRSCPDRHIDLVYTNPNLFFTLFHYWPEDDPRAK